MSLVLDLARKIRHAPGLRRVDGFWRVLRKPFHRALDPFGRGVSITLLGGQKIRLPADLTGQLGGWVAYEPECVAAVARWAESHPQGVFLDLGCALGLFSALALHASSRLEVVAFDSDLASLQTTRRVCRVAPHPARLLAVHGLVGDEHRSAASLALAAEATQQRLKNSALDGDPSAASYKCLADQPRGTLPEHSLDGLIGEAFARDASLLLKCDVEGAELLVLRGAVQTLARHRAALLLSVHPTALPSYGHSVPAVAAFLRQLGYSWTVISRDHEEHWWCEPDRALSPA